MANLETLELTITASAERAEQGVNILIRSLSRLSDALVRPYSDLKDMNDELRTLARLGKMKLSLFDGAGKSAAKTASAAREAVKAAKEMARVQERAQQNIDKEPPPPIKQGDPRWHEKMLAVEAKRRAEREARYTNAINAYNEQQRQRQAAVDAEHANSRQRALRAASLLNEGNQAELLKNKLESMATAYVSNAAAGKLTDEQMANGAIRIRQVYNRYVQLTQATNEQTESQRNLGETATQTGNRMEGLRNVFSRVARIAQTMLIRTALKSLLKGLTEAWQGAYSFSQKMGGEFAKNVDRAQASLKSMATSVVRLLGPAMQAIAPVIKVVATAVSFLSDAIANLLKALGLTSELFGTSVEELASYEGGAGKAAKGILAGFDELNVIQNQSGGGSGSGGSSPLGDFVGEINNQLALLKVIIGESMLGIGLILMCSGHPAYGLALMVLGASSIASALTADWEKLPKDVKGTITGVMTVVAGASLALGAIIALTSPAHLGLGIALMAIGAANLAAVAAVNWSSMGNNVDEQISKIATIVGGALVALGAVIAFACPTHLGLGVALMAAGAASLATAAAISWGDASGNVKNQITVIAGIVGGAALAIGALLTFAGPGTQGIGIALMVAGAASIATAAALSWSDTTGKVKKQVTDILTIVGGAALVIGAILTFSGAAVPLGIGLMAAGGASLATAVALNWDSITDKIKGVFKTATDWLTKQWDKVKEAVSGAWEAVKTWWETNISKPVEAAWKATVSYLTEKWDQIKSSVSTAWEAVGNWWTDVKGKISKVWDKIKEYVTGVWSSISTGVSDAWAAVGNWWTDVKGKISKVWDKIKEYITGVWTNVQTAASDAWTSVGNWWTDVKKKLSGVWDGVKEYITGIWEKIKKGVTDAWDSLTQWWGDLKKKLSGVWDETKKYLVDVWDGIKKGISNAWDNLAKWWGDLKAKLSEVWDAVKEYITGVWDNIKQGIVAAWNKLVDWWGDLKKKLSAVWDGVKEYVTGVWEAIKKGIVSAWNKLADWWGGLKKKLSAVWDGVKEYITGVWNSIKKGIVSAWNKLVDWWSNLKKRLSGTWDTVKEYITGVWSSIKKGIVAAWNKLVDWWGNLKKKLSGVWDGVKEYIVGVWGSIKKGIVAAWNKLVDWWGGLKEKLAAVWDAVKEYITGVWDSIKAKIVSAWNKLVDWWGGIKAKLAGTWDAVKKYITDVWNGIKKGITDAWKKLSQWWGNLKKKLSAKWDAVKEYITGIWTGIKNGIVAAWNKLVDWWGNLKQRLTKTWEDVKGYIVGIWDTVKQKITSAWNILVDWWNTNVYSKITAAWNGIKEFFEGIFKPIRDAWDWICKIFGGGTRSTRFEVGVDKDGGGWFASGTYGEGGGGSHGFANGGFPVNGELFIANEAGPELVGTMDGKTTVANQEQIVEGIRRGVYDAQSEQNALLRRQNELLTAILRKDASVKIGASSMLGRTVRQSLDMYEAAAGV